VPFVFEQFYLACLSHASYRIGSEGIAAVIDPQRDVDIYLATASEHGLEIRYIIETHLHADFVSGHRELAERTGATIYLGAQANAAFPHQPVRDGGEIAFGRCILRFLETPGHTIESISILVVDLDRAPQPFSVLTGDTLFIGDVGRPDLSPGYSPQDLAGMLHDSLRLKLMTLPDETEVYPAHGAGSLCGRKLSTERKSTIGMQRATNYALRIPSRESFIEMLTADLPERPAYFARDAEINRTGAPALAALGPVPELTPAVVLRLQRVGAIVLDTRPAREFAAAHVPGAIHIGLSGQYAAWAGALLDPDSTIILVAEDEDQVEESRTRLARVGIEQIAGAVEGGIAGWVKAKYRAAQLPQITVQDLQPLIGDNKLQIVDVRRPAERAEGAIPSAVGIPLSRLMLDSGLLDSQLPVAVYCQSGYRSSIASSLLLRRGFREVMNVIGGYEAWRACELPCEKPAQGASA
jgi:hydroxyacylglutathione hydrolase